MVCFSHFQLGKLVATVANRLGMQKSWESRFRLMANDYILTPLLSGTLLRIVKSCAWVHVNLGAKNRESHVNFKVSWIRISLQCSFRHLGWKHVEPVLAL